MFPRVQESIRDWRNLVKAIRIVRGQNTQCMEADGAGLVKKKNQEQKRKKVLFQMLVLFKMYIKIAPNRNT